MIQFLLLQNRQGKTRLSKYYRSYTDEEKVKLESEIHRLVTVRDPKFTNFVEVRASCACRQTPPCARTDARAPLAVEAVQADLPALRGPLLHPLRRTLRPAHSRPAPCAEAHELLSAAGLARALQDTTDNELVYFESIHLFVELLDQFFGNVCELDLVFNFNKVYMILDEFFLAGEVQETSKQAILHRVQELDKAE